jgi:hypothetical protein
VRAARSLADGADVAFDEGEAGVVLQLPPPVPESVVRVIVLELEPDSGTTSVQRAPAFANGPWLIDVAKTYVGLDA